MSISIVINIPIVIDLSIVIDISLGIFVVSLALPLLTMLASPGAPGLSKAMID